MNLFGVFNFGSLIKTFLPGLILFIVFILYLDLIILWTHRYIGIIEYLCQNPGLFVFISIPASVVLGISLNSIVFSGLSEYLLEKRHKKESEDFFKLKEYVFEYINESVFKYFNFGEDKKQVFIKSVDPRFFFLPKKLLSNLMYLRESYWYYMEFQLNTLLAVTAGMPAFIAALCVLENKSIIEGHVLAIAIVIIVLCWIAFSWLFMKSAKDNLDNHRKKELSFLLGVVFFELGGCDAYREDTANKRKNC